MNSLVAFLLLAILAVLAVTVWVTVSMPRRAGTGTLPPLSPDEMEKSDRLRLHVEALSGDPGGRNVFNLPALEKAMQYITGEFQGVGLEVRPEVFETTAPGVKVETRNLVAEVPGFDPKAPFYVIGAHYDSVLNAPGADDNASGVALLLELARRFQGKAFRRHVRFIAFMNEEPPFYRTPMMGSRVSAALSKDRGERILGMIQMDTIGFHSDLKGSQTYPFPLGLFYPDKGDFVAFVGNWPSRPWVQKIAGGFLAHSALPVQSVAAVDGVAGIGMSDHQSYWREGYRGLMVTDTAPYRYAHYHQPGDTPDKVDFDWMARVACGLSKTLEGVLGEIQR